ncbi:MAG: Protein of unknown function (DUF1553)/Protein of unknown function (DUF1549)/Planctomycete [Verrucomicrobiales bacterium]|nr:Protein of unknown function (DUF1553)/Protein of unknown function (DUF1549)/Planctomycete [Verrucomicrobiales bacterium]
MEAFLADDSKDAYDVVVQRLLDSARYGERWARHWMDVAHFAETHGNDQDRIRTNAWPYRDYLVKAFNTDKPYARFIQEQVAGDTLFPDDPQSTVAMGFLAAGPWDESSLRDIREDTLDRQIARYLDRDDIVTTVMQTFTSTTVQCARCHDHKFDPISQKEYYGLQSVFAGVERANRAYDATPAVLHKRRELAALKKRVEQSDPELLLSNSTEQEVKQWESEYAETKHRWKTIQPQTFVSTFGATLAKQADSSIVAGGVRPDRDIYTITATSSLPLITSVRLEVLTHTNLPHLGPGRQGNGNLHLSEFQMLVFDPGAGTAKTIELVNPIADFEESGQPIKQTLDNNEKTDWGIFPKVGQGHEVVYQLKEPLHVQPNATLMFVLKQMYGDGHLIGRLRMGITDAQPAAPLLPVSEDLAKILDTPAQKRAESERTALARAVLLRRVERQIAALPNPLMVYAAAADFVPDGNLKPVAAPRPVHVLRRGEVTKPSGEAVPGALACVAELPAEFAPGNIKAEGERRAALAGWLVDSRNVLTWRSIVNRVWHHHFGRGLVETPNDFGKMGGTPSNPELLDWLAIWFRDEAHGSFKALHRLLVTSSVYRQDVHTSGTGDADGHLVSRMPRTRLDAEQVRDTILQISGKLDLRMGGPSDMQFDLQPGIHVTPKVDYTKFDVDSKAGRRRGIYRFIFRTLPDPFMDALDCPAGDQLTPVRNASVTVQQALALWNDIFVARYSEHLARRLEREAPTVEKQVTRAFELALNRPANANEIEEFSAYAQKHGLPNFCRVLLNSNEFMFLN